MSEDILICPFCQTENNALSRTCSKCSQSLIIVCPRCNTINAITAEKCLACQLQFDTLGQIIARHEVRLEDRFTRQATKANDARAEERQTDEARTQQLWAQERQRQQYLLDQQRRQAQQERYLLIGVVVVSVVLLLIVLLVALIP
jgi:transcription initiation factor TFIID subunit TAF12